MILEGIKHGTALMPGYILFSTIMSQLYIVRYPESPIPVPEKGTLSIGRAENNTIVLAEPRISRNHAQIVWREDDEKFVLSDSGSSNGTYLNGNKILSTDTIVLNNWDKIRLASTVFTARFTDDSEEINNEFTELRKRVHNNMTEIFSVNKFHELDGQPALSGDLEHLCPIEIFQMLETGGKTGLLKVKTDTDEGNFLIDRGAIVKGDFLKSKAEMAVFEILKCSRGQFAFVPKFEIKEENEIQMATTALLMHCCKLMDEANGCAY